MSIPDARPRCSSVSEEQLLPLKIFPTMWSGRKRGQLMFDRSKAVATRILLSLSKLEAKLNKAWQTDRCHNCSTDNLFLLLASQLLSPKGSGDRKVTLRRFFSWRDMFGIGVGILVAVIAGLVIRLLLGMKRRRGRKVSGSRAEHKGENAENKNMPVAPDSRA
jgi:hypothetical protein